MSKVAEPRSKVAAADRGGVDQLAEHLGDRPRRAPAEAVGPEHPREVGVARTARGAGVEPAAALGDERLRRDLISTTQPTSTSPIVGSPSPSGAARDRDAGRLEARHRRPGAVDRVDDQHPLGRSPAGATRPRSSE